MLSIPRPFALLVLCCGVIALLAACRGGDAADEPRDGERAANAAVDRDGAQGEAGSVTTQQLADANNAFACDLYAAVAVGRDNLFFSPFSLEQALAMTMAGAEGTTAAEMQRTLRLPSAGRALYAAMRTWRQDLLPAGEEPAYELSVANRLWGQRGFDVRESFLAVCREDFAAEMGRLDFGGATDAARQQINAWVAEQTRDRIPELIPRGVLGERTRLVLANAIYFLGTWRHVFSAERTQEETFHLADGGAVTTPLMRQEAHFRYGETEGLQLLELGYRQAPLSLLVVLPARPDGLAAVERELTAARIAAWTDALTPRKVRVFLPRFELSARFSLSRVLAELGMPRAFGAQAEFGGIARDADLQISAVLHEAYVKVDEQGTEAAAATGVAVGVTSVQQPEEPVVFRADHPFLFLIRDVRDGTVLFIGRLLDPTS